MDKGQATEAIKQRFVDAWALTPAAAVPFVFDNDAADSAPTYVRVSVNEQASVQRTMGSAAIFERHGAIKVKICVPVDAGTNKAADPIAVDKLVKYVRKVYEAKRFGGTGPSIDQTGVITFAASSRPVGVDGEYWVELVDIPFRYDETRASIDA